MADVGDVLCVRTTGLFSWLIRFAARLKGKPDTVDHVAIVHHVDPDGTPWVIEAWATKGVRMISGDAYMASKWTVINADQPKTPKQRQQVAAVAMSLLHHGYDWSSIAEDAAEVFGLHDPLIRQWSAGRPPSRFVCSALAEWCYSQAGLACPSDGRFTTPGDWVTFVQQHN